MLCKGIEIGGRQWKLYITELMENERTEITIEKRLEHSLVFMLQIWRKIKYFKKDYELIFIRTTFTAESRTIQASK